MMMNSLNIMSWNASGLFSSGGYLCDSLQNRDIDVCGVSEHWLRETDLHFFDHFNSSYKCSAVCDRDLVASSSCTVRKGGVAILWHRKHNNRIVPLDVDDDRIIGVQLECTKTCYMYIFQTYLPSCNHPINRFREYIDRLSELIYYYSEKGTVIVMGDLNANLNSIHFQKVENERSRLLTSLLLNHNLVSLQTLDMCIGARSTFVSYSGNCESLIDHILISRDYMDSSCEIADDNALNVSNHRPVLCRLNVPQILKVDICNRDRRLKWEKATSDNLNDYECDLNCSETLKHILLMDIVTDADIEKVYTGLLKVLLEASDRYIPKASFKRFLKPYWNSELTVLHGVMSRLRCRWINAGRPRGSGAEPYVLYKGSKSEFRKLHRRAVDAFLVNLNREIDNSADLDSKLFWKLVNGRKSASCTDAGGQINFDGEIVRNSEDLACYWGKYFKTLYSPDSKPKYDETFHDEISRKISRLHSDIYRDIPTDFSDFEIQYDMLNGILNKCKRGKAAGGDGIAYEHLMFGGHVVKSILCKLFNAMLKNSFVPRGMKRGIIITLFKGGNKLKTDPNNYRAITLSSVFVRLYENILLKLIDARQPLVFNSLQGGFQRNLSCLMTSFSLKESIYMSQEYGSKLFVCFLDAKQAFDRVWHDGLFSKLYDTNIDPIIYKAFVSMYKDIESRVRFRGYLSDWFPVLRGTRQGGVSSPKLYLLYIDGLLREIEASGLGFCIFNCNFASPTVADDMCLVTLSKHAMDQLLDMCYRYSCRWRYDYNPKKCAVVVYNEDKVSAHRSTRVWHLGPEIIEEKESYTHLGLHLDKWLDCGPCCEGTVTKLRQTFFGLIGSGLHRNGLNPITSTKIYRSAVIPRALYGCELMNDISSSQMRTIERCHNMCIRIIQGLPRYSSASLALSMIGCENVESIIDYRKLIFFGQLCNMQTNHIVKHIFSNRLMQYHYSAYGRRGFMPDIYRLLGKYNLLDVVESFINTSFFPSRYQWKRLVRGCVNSKGSNSRHIYMLGKGCFSAYLQNCCNILSPSPIWFLAQQYPHMLPECQSTAILLSKLFCNDFAKTCEKCGDSVSNLTLHIVHYCSKNETIRQRLWGKLLEFCGHNTYRCFIQLNARDQVTHLTFGLCHFIENDLDREQCLKFVVKTFHSMSR